MNSEVVAEKFESAGAYVIRRRMADGGEVPWGDTPPFRAPAFVVTHGPRQKLVLDDRGSGGGETRVLDERGHGE